MQEKSSINRRPKLRFHREDREEVYNGLCKHSQSVYPCDECEHPDHVLGAVQCAHKACPKWQEWFRKEWTSVTDSLYEKLKK